MEKTEASKDISSTEVYDDINELFQTLPQERNWDGRWLCQYKGFWCPERCFRPIVSSQRHFDARDTDILLASMPKSGTTWLKALIFSIVNRNNYSIDQTPLLTCNPHSLVTFLEFNVYWGNDSPDLESIPSPRMFSTHMPYELLPNTILESKCRVVYICRNPLDQFISHRHFLLENKLERDAEPLAIDEAFEMFCKGIHPFGPFWDHMIGYWNASLNSSEKVLFLKYEDLKEDIVFSVTKIAEFIGLSFSVEEEKQGLIEQISRLQL
ncbi:cytosolic sulfotransferase 15-like [Olea europaea subsp. europaea]|nr:cytosolic sulfotransferase 15-like [Olea europaea subsp. europaea]